MGCEHHPLRDGSQLVQAHGRAGLSRRAIACEVQLPLVWPGRARVQAWPWLACLRGLATTAASMLLCGLRALRRAPVLAEPTHLVRWQRATWEGLQVHQVCWGNTSSGEQQGGAGSASRAAGDRQKRWLPALGFQVEGQCPAPTVPQKGCPPVLTSPGNVLTDPCPSGSALS